MFIQSRNQQYKINHPKSAIPHFTPKIISKLCQTRNKMFNIQHMFSLSISHSKICTKKKKTPFHPKLKNSSHKINYFTQFKSHNPYKIYKYINSKIYQTLALQIHIFFLQLHTKIYITFVTNN
jgi:hypothetical protein